MPWPNPEAIQTLQECLLVFQSDGFAPYREIPATRRQDGVIEVGYVSYASEVTTFIEAMYETDTIIAFDWNTQAWKTRYEEIAASTDAHSQASDEELRKMLTTMLRADRFNEGFLAEQFDNGLFISLLSELCGRHTDREP